MKNIHVLPTDKLQNIKLSLFENKLYLGDIASTALPQNIYITSDEEIKEGDWIFDLDTKSIVKADSFKVITSKKSKCWYYKKIILTTDQDLIADGVQAIDDEFLEWFVKNPSCEWVEVEDSVWDGISKWIPYYDIIIPKEEHKQETLGYICPTTKKQCDDECCVSAEDCHIEAGFGIVSDCELPKQETLEEVAETELRKQNWDTTITLPFNGGFIEGFQQGARWQQEQDKNKYSEEEVRSLLIECCGEVSCEDGALVGKSPAELVKWIDTKFKKK